MKTEVAGITRANEGIQGISWNILGQTYVPKSRTEHSFSWHATFPPGTFVPPHIHPDQDEYLYILEGRLDFMLDGADDPPARGGVSRGGLMPAALRSAQVRANSLQQSWRFDGEPPKAVLRDFGTIDWILGG